DVQQSCVTYSRMPSSRMLSLLLSMLSEVVYLKPGVRRAPRLRKSRRGGSAEADRAPSLRRGRVLPTPGGTTLTRKKHAVPGFRYTSSDNNTAPEARTKTIVRVHASTS